MSSNRREVIMVEERNSSDGMNAVCPPPPQYSEKQDVAYSIKIGRLTLEACNDTFSGSREH